MSTFKYIGERTGYCYNPEDKLHSMHKVIEHLYQGDSSSNSLEVLKHHKIMAIVNASNTCSVREVKLRKEQLGIDEIHIPIDDDNSMGDSIYSYFDQVADFIETHIQANHNVLVHCMAGVSRSSTFTLCYLIKYKKMTLRAAFSVLTAARKIALPNPGFWMALLRWEGQQLACLPNYTGPSVRMVVSRHGGRLIPDCFFESVPAN